jgi:hypothetical protein
MGVSEHYGEYDHGLHEPCRRPARPSTRWGMMREIAALAGWGRTLREHATGVAGCGNPDPGFCE